MNESTGEDPIKWPDDDQSLFSNAFQLYTVMIIMSTAAVIAIAGNLLIVVLFLRIKKEARLTPHIFLTNLALCDLILGLKLPLFFLVTLAKRDAWIFVDPMACAAAATSDTFAFRSVVMGMIAVAVDRYLAVLHATRYQMILTERRAFIGVLLVWTWCILWSGLPLAIAETSDDVHHHYSVTLNTCVMDQRSRETGDRSLLLTAFVSTDLLLNFICPLLVMTVCYVRIAKKVLSPRNMGNTIKKFMRSTSRSLRRGTSSEKDCYNLGTPAKTSEIGIKVEQFDQSRNGSTSDDDDDDENYIELPAITKRIDPIEMHEVMNGSAPTQPSAPPKQLAPVIEKRSTDIESMYEKTGLAVAIVPPYKFKLDSHSTPNSKRGSWTEDSAQAIKEGARKMSSVVTSSVLHQLKKLSHASNAYSKMSKYQQKIARTTVLVYLSFFFCYTPYIASQAVRLSIGKWELTQPIKAFSFTSVCLAYFTTCINVIIYGTMHRNIRSTLKGLFS